MAEKHVASPSAAYLTQPNIIHPESERGSADGELRVAAAEARARTELAGRLGVTSVTGGSIQRGR